jgi:hypothetical protein
MDLIKYLTYSLPILTTIFIQPNVLANTCPLAILMTSHLEADNQGSDNKIEQQSLQNFFINLNCQASSPPSSNEVNSEAIKRQQELQEKQLELQNKQIETQGKLGLLNYFVPRW